MDKLSYHRLKGQRIFILGSGPSLKKHYLSLLKNENVILPNRTIELAKQINSDEWTWCWNDMNYLPDIAEYDIYDSLGLMDEYILENMVVGMEINMRDYWLKHLVNYSNIMEQVIHKVPFDCSYNVEDGFFSANIIKSTYCGWTVVIDLAIPLAIWWGCPEIYLIGCDTERTKHFCNDKLYATDQQIERTKMGYSVIKKKCDKEGVQIFNAGIGGSLDVFERVDYNSLF
jgi:hypothetical protein